MSTETTEQQRPSQELMPNPMREQATIDRQRAMAETTFTSGISPFSNGDAFKLACAMAERIALSTFIPKDYQNNPENVLVAMDYASRLGLGLMMVMQNMDVVHGRPGLRGTLLAALINASPLFSRLKYEFRGTDNPGGKPTLDYGCRAYATESATGEVIVGTWIDWRMVEGEGWNKNTKWTSIRDQMFQYRAASFWSRAHASDITLGLHTAEELEDVALKADYTRIDTAADRLRDRVDTAIEQRESAAGEDGTPTEGTLEASPIDAKPRGRRVVRRVREAPAAAPEPERADATEQAKESAAVEGEDDDAPPFDTGDAGKPEPPASEPEPKTEPRPTLNLE